MNTAIASLGDSTPAVQISTVGVVTCDRHPQLMRCLNTYADNMRLYGRTPNILVADDSGDANARTACREWLSSFSQRTQLSVFYVGLEEKLEFQQRLIEGGVPERLVRFALTNVFNVARSPGANRNALMLHTVGEAFLSCDDDSVCWIGDLRDGYNSVEVSPIRGSLQDIQFVGSRARAVKEVTRCVCDLLSAHEQLLGRTLPDLARAATSGPNDMPEKIGIRSLCDLAEERGKVVVTLTGVVGESGIPEYYHFFMSRNYQGTTRQRFLECWQAHGDVEATHSIVSGVHRPTVIQGRVATTTATGFDNRELLVPFISSGCGEDTVFGNTLVQTMSDAYIGHVPFALLHAPPYKKPYRPLKPDFTIMDMIRVVLERSTLLLGDSVKTRIKRLGQYLIECGEADVDDFADLLRRRAILQLFYLIDRSEQFLDEFKGVPAELVDSIEKYIVALQSAIKNPGAGAPTDFGASLSVPERYRLAQQFIKGFGELLCWWPEMVTETQRLKSKGVTLGKRLS